MRQFAPCCNSPAPLTRPDPYQVWLTPDGGGTTPGELLPPPPGLKPEVDGKDVLDIIANTGLSKDPFVPLKPTGLLGRKLPWWFYLIVGLVIAKLLRWI